MSAARAASGDTVLTIVDRCRRRMRLVSIVRRTGVTIPAAIITVEFVALFLQLTTIQLVAVTAAAALLALAVAAIPAILRAPSMRATAAAIDARLHLQDRIVTALQQDRKSTRLNSSHRH